jgi:hypothetical protein
LSAAVIASRRASELLVFDALPVTGGRASSSALILASALI